MTATMVKTTVKATVKTTATIREGISSPQFWPCVLLSVCVGVGCLMIPTDAYAGRKNTAPTSTKLAPQKGTKVQYTRSSSEESRAERDRRLLRECRGKNNAGACLGYTRK